VHSKPASMPVFKEKQVQKFNSLLLLFLQDVCKSVPDVSIVQSARDSVSALVVISPGDTSILESFMTGLQGCADFLVSHNTDVFEQASSISSLVTKEDVIAIYKQLDERDRETTWKYVTKLYDIGKKACPSLVREGEFDFNNLNANSPIHGLITAAKTMGGIEESGGKGGLVRQAFRQMTVNMLDTVAADCNKDADIIKACEDTKALIASTEGTDVDCKILTAAFEVFYKPDEAQGLIMDTEATVRAHGFPFLPGGGEFAGSVLDNATNPAAIIAAVMQVGTVYITITSMDPKMVQQMEGLARRFYKKMEDGEIDFTGATDPVSMLAVLASSGLTEEIFSLVQAM
jgi:hypothetical protein